MSARSRSTATPRALEPGSSTRRFLGLLRPVRGRFLAVVVLTAFGVGLTAIGPLVLARATDTLVNGLLGAQLPSGQSREEVVAALRASGRETLAGVVASTDLVPGRGIDFGELGRLLGVTVGIYSTATLLQLVAVGQTNRAIHHVMLRLRVRVERKLNRTPVATVDTYGRGDLLSRVTNDVDNTTASLTQAMGQLLTACFTLISVLVAMLYLSPLMTLVTLSTLPLAVWATRALVRRSQPRFVAQWKQMGALSATIEESISGHEVISSFHSGQQHVAELGERNDRWASESVRAQVASGLAMPLMTFVGNLSYVLVCVVGGLRVASATMTVGEIQAFVQYGRQISSPIGQISGLLNELQSGIASTARVLEFLDGPEEETGVPERRRLRGRVEFEHVDFGYEPGKPVLRDLSLVAEPGETVAVVGPTGVGKTTLAHLLLRFYDVERGRVLLDGHDVRELARADVRSHIGVVLQDPWLFEGTIAENVSYGRQDAHRSDVERAASRTGLDQFVAVLPHGLDTHIDADGANLSAGERQLVTITRAFVAEPEVLVLDEATSAVDSRTTMHVQRALAELQRDRTCLVIAHRLATVRQADRILVLDQGRVVESGSHEELLHRRGAYAELQRTRLEAS
ncbi:ATP-binding cassette, subfamily B [Actinopolyspora xinjiangensis]|uniref:Fatty acid ABC transporter ATP-binding/permease protein n=1 Tax=Actinopolyspora xinjiangensis TaxID=405564 RepID=A0A1H0V8S5_9ACTN|nr:ABC transporter ATP-binding protein [Actinopolyspora xinjiangensis]SDP74618.1 ATP-binding cassette, subfamily B [Actinopolyspora xinjiangensis]